MKNHLYYDDMVTANEYLKSRELPNNFESLKNEMRNPRLTHSDKWSLAYDYFHLYGLETKYVTGFVYSEEGGM